MGTARVDPVDRARVIVLSYMASSCCRPASSMASSAATLDNAETPYGFHIDSPLERTYFDTYDGPALADDTAIPRNVLVVIIAVLLSVAVIHWYVFA